METIDHDVKIFGKVDANELNGKAGDRLLLQIETKINETVVPLIQLAATVEELKVALTETNAIIASQKASIETLTAKYNAAIAVINDLSERVIALESNYDPTVIK